MMANGEEVVMEPPKDIDELAQKYSDAVRKHTEVRNALSLLSARRHIVKAAEKEISRDNAAVAGQKMTEARLEDIVNSSEAMATLLQEEDTLRKELVETSATKAYYGVFCRGISDEPVE